MLKEFCIENVIVSCGRPYTYFVLPYHTIYLIVLESCLLQICNLFILIYILVV